jgi:putative SOS response-associated peptidase YedK
MLTSMKKTTHTNFICQTIHGSLSRQYIKGYFIKRFALLTREAVGAVGSVVNQMPYILMPDDAERWLTSGNVALEDAVTEIEFVLTRFNK